ncbi:hypothetical protein [Anaeroselena agilis]|uniref:Uncharacterized protein n=1 Tax=Anaeroselena agilis TaxID=3063788 RepID=A0ABU3NWG5_9FIRM|nr:hypothetical protein [Selenomonadales bacterium 4137-cl]
MDLQELFPKEAKVAIGGKEYSLRFSPRGLRYLEQQYKDKELPGITEGQKPVKMKDAIAIIVYFLAKAQFGLTIDEVYHLLFAGLAHTKAFPDFDDFLDVLDEHHTREYANQITIALALAYYTPEQIKKVEVMAERAKADDSSKNAGEPATRQ